MSSSKNPLTVEDIAAAHRLRVGFVLYLRNQPGFPKPLKKPARVQLFDREAIARYFKKWSAPC